MPKMLLLSQYANFYHQTKFFSLRILPKKSRIIIKMQLNTNIVNTKYLPHTLGILERELPNVLKTRCFNEENIPFKIEVKNTEIGHLFEHILLENLCVEKYRDGINKVVFNGRTKWNWIDNPYGSFDIFIDANFNDLIYFFPALKKTIKLTETILDQTTSMPIDQLIIGINPVDQSINQSILE